MGSWRKVGAFFGLAPDDSQGYEGEYDEQHFRPDGGQYGADYGRSPYHPEPVADPGQAYAGGHRDFGDPVTDGALAMQPRLEPRPAYRRDADTAGRPVTVKLTGFGEARGLGEKYRDGQSVILDMTDMSDSDARRLVDFAAGLAFALHGSIDKVTTKVFMLLPPDAEVSAEDRRAFAGSYGR